MLATNLSRNYAKLELKAEGWIRAAKRKIISSIWFFRANRCSFKEVSKGESTIKAALVLADGFRLEGKFFTSETQVTAGEVVFNTSMTGYQEIITDPSYRGQIVALTYPLIGNYGVHPEDSEADSPRAEGLIVREYCAQPYNHRARETLGEYLDRHGLVGIESIDTRALTRHIRSAGAMKGVIAPAHLPQEELVARARSHPDLAGRDLVQTVTCSSPYRYGDAANSYHVVALDLGIKRSILERLEAAGMRSTGVPASTSAREIVALDPNGVFLSNGPGDPAAVQYAVRTVSALLGWKPVFGICLGHQILGLALGLSTYKLKFGHHAGNHPVVNLQTGRVEITAQNHGFCVRMPAGTGQNNDHVNPEHSPEGSKPQSANKTGELGGEREVGMPCTGRGRGFAAEGPRGLEVTHVNLNDSTLEGLRHSELGCFSVQHHPESAPGPHDSRYLFSEFADLITRWQQRPVPAPEEANLKSQM